jgi:hypothetical protein
MSGIVRFEHEVVALARPLDVGVVIQRLRIPVGILEHDVLEVVDRVAHRHRAPPQLAAAFEPWKDVRAGAWVARACIDAPDAISLRRREAPAGSAPSLHTSTFGSNLQASRILEHAVLRAVEIVTRSHYGIVHERELLARQRRCRIGKRLVKPESDRTSASTYSSRRARDDAVEVFRIALRRGQRLTATRGTSVEVRQLRHVAVEAIDGGFGCDRRLVNRAMCESR